MKCSSSLTLQLIVDQFHLKQGHNLMNSNRFQQKFRLWHKIEKRLKENRKMLFYLGNPNMKAFFYLFSFLHFDFKQHIINKKSV